MKKLICTVVILTAMISLSTGFRAYDCFHDKANITSISLSSVDQCAIPEDSKIHVRTVQAQIIQEKNWRYLHVFHCNVVVKKLITHCGMHSHSSITRNGLQQYIHDLSYSECMEMQRDGTMNFEGYDVTGLLANQTSDISFTHKGYVDNDGNCHGVSFSSPEGNYHNVVVHVTMNVVLKDYNTLFEIKSDNIVFNDGTSCNIDQMDCVHHSYGPTFWSNSEYDRCSPVSRDILYEGPVQISGQNSDNIEKGDVVAVNRGTSLFSLTIKSPSHICHQSAFSTDHNRIYVITKATHGFYFAKTKIISQNIDLSTYMNSKISYATHHTEQMIKNIYKELTLRDCEVERMTLLNKIAIVKQHPMAYGHITTNEKGYYSVVSGEVAHMIKCQPVEATIRKIDHCTSHLPIYYNNASSFMEPVARIITNSSREIPCSAITPTMYEIGDNWYSFNPYPAQVMTPRTLSPTVQTSDYKTLNIHTIMNSGLYDENTMDMFRKFMSFPLIRQEANSYLAVKLSGDIGYSETNFDTRYLMNPQYIQDKVNQGLYELLGFVTKFGAFAGAVWGFFMLYKIMTKMVSIIINALSLHKHLGWGFHMFGSILNSVTHYIISKMYLNTQDRTSGGPTEGSPQDLSRDHTLSIEDNVTKTQDDDLTHPSCYPNPGLVIPTR